MYPDITRTWSGAPPARRNRNTITLNCRGGSILGSGRRGTKMQSVSEALKRSDYVSGQFRILIPSFEPEVVTGSFHD